jgi:hypothetical protein
VQDDVKVEVDELMARVRDRVLELEERPSHESPTAERTYVYASELDASSIEALLHTARRMAAIRTVWPRRLWVFPFTLSPWMRRSLLRFFAFMFNDQRHVDFALIEAVREQLQITKEMHGLIASLQSEVRQLEERLQRIEPHDAAR